ncbi:hypothetical protein BDW69DRAFT_173695 [Aspergillus filifer]
MVENNEATLSELEKEYCPPLDHALFTAIVFDYDLSDAAQLQQLRETLDALKHSAWEQEDLPFDPSGTSGLNSNGSHESDPSISQADTNPSRGTDATSEFSALSLNDRSRSTCPSRVSYIVGPDGTLSLSGATEDDKIFYLSEMFPTTERFTIEHTLRKSNGDVDKCMDVLLNFAFFEGEQLDEDGKVSLPKGIDGFENGDAGRKKSRKRRGKNRSGKNRDNTSSDSLDSDFVSEPINTFNKWTTAQRDVDFICARTFPILKKETVTSAYHANGASLPATIQALAKLHAPKDRTVINEHPVMTSQIDELKQDFPEIIPGLLAGLLKITRNSISAAHELAKAYMTVPAPRPAAELIKFTSTPPLLDIEEEAPKRRTATSSSSRDYEAFTASAGYHYTAGTEALTKASAAFRRGKSDKLMGGAAAYYSAVGRDHLERAKRDAAASADEYARRNATANSIDLHGLSVQDAVRITSDHVSEWWESLGESKYMRGSDGNAARGGYRIITGVGRHSHDGTSRLGPAVGKMLAREGWRVNVEPGVLTVVGIVRRR